MKNQQEMNLASSRAKVIKALAHPSRIFMVEYISKNDVSVSELAEEIGADVSTISKHLSILKQAGILIDRKEGNRVLYSLLCPCIMNFIHCIDDVIVQDAKKGMSCIIANSDVLKDGADPGTFNL
jgi:ArsR family transcriptional regulator, arsenate/arsenite/antimonite-responsive transcriptional repressor